MQIKEADGNFCSVKPKTAQSDVETKLLSYPLELKYKYYRFTNKKYVLSNSESVQCNFFIFDHVTFIQFEICCCVQNFINIR